MFETAYSLAQKRHGQPTRIATSIRLLDNMLEGGFEIGLSHLLYGSPSCTELLIRCIGSALEQVAPTCGVIVIDGNNGIRPDQLFDYLKANATTHPPTIFMERLHVARAFTTDQLLSLINDSTTHIKELQAPILFVNGITHLLEEEESALPELNPKRPTAPMSPLMFRRAQFAAMLKQLAFKHQVAVIASADGPKRVTQPSLRIGQATRHSFHVLIHYTHQGKVDTFTLQKHPTLPYRQWNTVSIRTCPPEYPGLMSWATTQTRLD